MIWNRCGNCNAHNKPGERFWVHGTYMWANQYGQCIRYFCHWCGNVWEIRTWGGGESYKQVGQWATKYDDSRWPISPFPN